MLDPSCPDHRLHSSGVCGGHSRLAAGAGTPVDAYAAPKVSCRHLSQGTQSETVCRIFGERDGRLWDGGRWEPCLHLRNKERRWGRLAWQPDWEQTDMGGGLCNCRADALGCKQPGQERYLQGHNLEGMRRGFLPDTSVCTSLFRVPRLPEVAPPSVPKGCCCGRCVSNTDTKYRFPILSHTPRQIPARLGPSTAGPLFSEPWGLSSASISEQETSMSTSIAFCVRPSGRPTSPAVVLCSR